MKALRALPMLLLLLAVLAVPARADELRDALDLPDVAGAAPPEAREILGDADPEDADLDRGLTKLWDALRARFPDTMREALRPLASMLAVTLLCSLAESFSAGPQNAELVTFGGCLAVAAIGAQDVRSVLTLGSETLQRLGEFSRVLLPTLTTVSAAAGAPGAAGAVWAASALFSELLLTAAETVVLPLICGFTAAACAASVLGERRLDGAVQLLQWAARTLLKGLALAFTAYLAVSKALGAASDAATVKTARALLSAAVPVVGRLLSDASEALVAGAGLLRASVGVYGMLAVLAALLTPLARLALRYLAFRAAAAVCAGIAGERISKLIGQLGTAYALLLGLICTAAAAELLSIIALIRTVTP